MVTFELFFFDNKIAKYYYWSQGIKSKQPGIITVDLSNGTFEVTKLAEDDHKYVVTAKELNDFLNIINKSRIEQGEEPYDDYTDKDEVSYFFADHAIHVIRKNFAKGEMIKQGYSAWY